MERGLMSEDALRREVTNPVNNCMAITDILVSEGRCPPVGACGRVGEVDADER